MIALNEARASSTARAGHDLRGHLLHPAPDLGRLLPVRQHRRLDIGQGLLRVLRQASGLLGHGGEDAAGFAMPRRLDLRVVGQQFQVARELQHQANGTVHGQGGVGEALDLARRPDHRRAHRVHTLQGLRHGRITVLHARDGLVRGAVHLLDGGENIGRRVGNMLGAGGRFIDLHGALLYGVRQAPDAGAQVVAVDLSARRRVAHEAGHVGEGGNEHAGEVGHDRDFAGFGGDSRAHREVAIGHRGQILDQLRDAALQPRRQLPGVRLGLDERGRAVIGQRLRPCLQADDVVAERHFSPPQGDRLRARGHDNVAQEQGDQGIGDGLSPDERGVCEDLRPRGPVREQM